MQKENMDSVKGKKQPKTGIFLKDARRIILG